MNVLSTIIVLILACLGVLAMWRTGWDVGGAAARITSTQRLLAREQIPPDELVRITLARHGEPTLVFERIAPPTAAGGEAWQQIQPFGHPMETYAMRQLALQALELETTDRISPAELAQQNLTLESLGLDPPLAEIRYETSNAGSLTLRLGRRSVAGRAYAQIAGNDNAVHIIDQRLHDRVEMDDEQWRHRTIFPGAGIDSAQIEWRNGDFKLTLVRQGRQWMMTEPVRTRLDPGQRDMYMQAIGTAAISAFVLDQPAEPDLQRFGLKDTPVSLSVTMHESSAAPQRLFIGSRAGGGTMDHFGLIEGRPVVVRISGAVIAALFRQPRDLIDATGSGVNPADVKSILISTAHEEVRLERELETWRGSALTVAPDAAADQQPHDAARQVNAAHVNELLEQLTNLRAPNIEIAAEYPRHLEVATITFRGYDGKAIDTVRILHDPQSGTWALENGDNVLRVFPGGFKLRLTAQEFGLN